MDRNFFKLKYFICMSVILYVFSKLTQIIYIYFQLLLMFLHVVQFLFSL